MAPRVEGSNLGPPFIFYPKIQIFLIKVEWHGIAVSMLACSPKDWGSWDWQPALGGWLLKVTYVKCT